jgi:peroxiredoxin Q/BCP
MPAKTTKSTKATQAKTSTSKKISPKPTATLTKKTESLLPEVGKAAPKFKVDAVPSGPVSLSDYLGKKNVVLAFYPRDNTPGCTIEACGFSKDLDKFKKADTEILSISCDSVTSHEKFAGRFKLKQTILSDSDGKVGKAYGVIPEGKSTAQRALFIIDKKGVIKHVHKGMPDNAKLLKVIKELE